MSKIRIEFTKPKNHPLPLISYLIRFFTMAGYSHSLINFVENKKFFHIYFNSSVLDCVSIKEEKHEVVSAFDLNVSSQECLKIYHNCFISNGRETKGYYVQLLGSLLVMPFRLFGIYLKNPFTGLFTSQLCSQYIVEKLALSFNVNGILTETMEKKIADINTMNTRDLFDMLDHWHKLSGRGVSLPFGITRVR